MSERPKFQKLCQSIIIWDAYFDFKARKSVNLKIGSTRIFYSFWHFGVYLDDIFVPSFEENGIFMLGVIFCIQSSPS